MFELLLNRTTVISLAIIGALFSMLASWYKTRGTISENNVRWLNKTAYIFMSLSIILFIGAGMFGTQ